MTAGTAAAVPPARPHTGETAGVTPEEESAETEHMRNTNTRTDREKKKGRNHREDETTPVQPLTNKHKLENKHRSQPPE